MLLVGRTTRIRRRRGVDVADTTDSLRAVACIRFVRPWLSFECGWLRNLGHLIDQPVALVMLLWQHADNYVWSLEWNGLSGVNKENDPSVIVVRTQAIDPSELGFDYNLGCRTRRMFFNLPATLEGSPAHSKWT